MSHGAATPPISHLRSHFVPRNTDGAAYDRTLADWTADATWRDWDLSAIVPAGATAIVLNFYIKNNTYSEYLAFRRNGNSNTIEVLKGTVMKTNADQWFAGIVPCDDGRVIEYCATNGGTWASLSAVVMGWYT